MILARLFSEDLELSWVAGLFEKNFYRLPFTPPLSGRRFGPSSANYETLRVDELFSKLKSSEVDRRFLAKAKSPTDPHSLALVGGSGYGHANTPRHFALSSLVSLPDEEYEVLSEEDLALLTRRFERMYQNRKGSRRVGSTCYRCGKKGHFIAECL